MECWQNLYIIVLRILIDDNSDEPTYTDSRLEDVLVVAASQVAEEARISTYTIDITPPEITPTPIADDTFRNLVTLKAACIIDRGNLRHAAMVSGLEARCGPAIMRTNKRVDGFKILIEQGYCKAYDEALRQYIFGNVSFARGILSPFINSDFFPEYYAPDSAYSDPRTGYYHRRS
jgi:hypothetical protein